MRSTIINSLIFLSVLFIGCDNNEGAVKKTVTVTLKNTEDYTYSFGIIGLEDSGSIKQQPGHAIVSDLRINGDGYLIYSYQPEAGYVGKDQVQIEICFSRGDGKCYSTELTTIKFTITD